MNPAVTLGPGTLPADTVNVPYSQTIAADGGTGTVTLAVSNVQGAIPGLTVPASGTGSLAISGTPTAAGTETFAVIATDSLGATASDRLQHHGQSGGELWTPRRVRRIRSNMAYSQTIVPVAGTGTGTVTLAVSDLQGAIPGLMITSQRDGQPGDQRCAHGRGDGDLHRHGDRFSGRHDQHGLQHPSQPDDELRPGDAPGGHGERGLLADDRGYRGHGNGDAGGGQHPGGNPRAGGTGQRDGQPGDQRYAHSRRDGDLHRHRHRLPGRHGDHQLQRHGEPGGELGPGDAAGRHGESGLQPDDHGRRGHGHGDAGGEQHSGDDRRADGAASGTGSLAISGTPTAAGTETFTVTATDSLGVTASADYSITVNPAVSLGPATLPADTASRGLQPDDHGQRRHGHGDAGGEQHSRDDPGLTLPASGTGSLAISGTPTAAGTETFTVTATDSLGVTASANYSITVNPAVSLGPATLPADTVNVAYSQTITASGGTGTMTLAVSNIQGAIPA